MTTKPWNRIEQREGESVMDHTCRVIDAMVSWSHAHRADEDSIGFVARTLARHDEDAASAFYHAATARLYERFPECPEVA